MIIWTSLEYETNNFEASKMIEEIIELCGSLVEKLDAAIEAEHKFNVDMQIEFEKYSWEIIRMSNEIQAIKQRYC